MSSAIPGTIAALVARFAGAGVSGLQVTDGEPLEAEPNYVAVAFTGDDDQSDPVSGVAEVADADMDADLESFDIACQLSFSTGDSDPVALRTAMFAAFTKLRQALAADRTLGGAVARSRITDYAYRQPLPVEGATTVLAFTVHNEAWRQP